MKNKVLASFSYGLNARLDAYILHLFLFQWKFMYAKYNTVRSLQYFFLNNKKNMLYCKMAYVSFLIHYTFPKVLNMYDCLTLHMTPLVMTDFNWKRAAFNF